MSDSIDLLEIETSEISIKYKEILEEINNERKKLEHYYDEKEIIKLEEEYKYYKNSEKKGLCNYALKYENYIKIKKDYEEYLENKPLENPDDIKIYINKKIDKLKYDLLNKNICEEILLKNKKLKKYEKKYELYIFYEFMSYNFSYEYWYEELEKIQDEHNFEIIKNYLKGKFYPKKVNHNPFDGQTHEFRILQKNKFPEEHKENCELYVNYMLRRDKPREALFESINNYLTIVEKGIMIMELDENNFKKVNDAIKKKQITIYDDININNPNYKSYNLEEFIEFYKQKNDI